MVGVQPPRGAQTHDRHTQELIVALLIAAGALTVLPAAAQAGLGAKNSIELLPKTVRVGDSGTATLNLVNDDLAPDTGATNTICNFGDSCPSVTDPDGILVVPSCHALAVGTVCNAGDEDPGVFAFSSTGTGALGSSCAGMVFDIARVPSVPDVGAYRFTPQGGAHVTLAGADAFCNVNFAYAVRRAPRDADPGTAGLQTITYAAHSEISPAQPLSNAHARGATINSTVLLAQPTIATTASGNATLGTALSDHAIVSGLVAPAAGATITFLLYGPDNAACSGTPLFTSTQTAAIAGSTATATSSAFAPTAAGTYRWTAAYSGDANNLPVAGACGDSGETQTVTVACTPAPATPPPGGSVCATVPATGLHPAAGARAAGRHAVPARIGDDHRQEWLSRQVLHRRGEGSPDRRRGVQRRQQGRAAPLRAEQQRVALQDADQHPRVSHRRAPRRCAHDVPCGQRHPDARAARHVPALRQEAGTQSGLHRLTSARRRSRRGAAGSQERAER